MEGTGSVLQCCMETEVSNFFSTCIYMTNQPSTGPDVIVLLFCQWMNVAYSVKHFQWLIRLEKHYISTDHITLTACL